MPKPGGNELSRKLDREKCLQDFIHLSFVNYLPMLHLIKKAGRIDPIVLEINKSVMYRRKTLFSNINVANKIIKPKIGESIDCFKKINFNIFKKKYLDLNENDRKFYQAEVLVYKKISSKYILNLNDYCRKQKKVTKKPD